MSSASSIPLLPWIGSTNATWLVRLLPFAWLFSDAITPIIGFGRHEMRVVVDVSGWALPGWGLLPFVAVTFAAARGAVASGTIRQRLDAAIAAAEAVGRWLAAPVLLLVALRALSLWGSAGVLFPWLSLVWTPHVSIALAMVPFLSGRQRDERTQHRSAMVLAGVFFLLYTGYTIYICQMVMLHGDEAQYLRVTQSLLRDGDIDLANNLDGDIREFHVIDVDVHRAPGAPDGVVYSKHPVGLSVLMMPAYEIGLRLWQYPRLATALVIAVWAAACIPLLYLWLCRVGFAHAISLWVTVACATTTPLLLFSSQIYPEIPAVLVSLLVLLRIDQRLWQPGRDSPSGATSGWELGGLSLLVGGLPFLHPRYAPLSALLGGGLLWQAWPSRERGAAVVSGALLAGVALIWHNISFSGDWLGNFRPGAAWEEDALSVGTWVTSLPGHWLHETDGLALNATWYVIAVVAGVSLLAWSRDRRLLLAGALYGSTAMINGLHPDWTFGFCQPTRFLLTALPALALCAAAGWDQLRRTPLGGTLLCGALVLSWDIIAVAMQIPELPFRGSHLGRTSLAGYYPFDAHGFRETVGFPPPDDLLFWGLATCAVIAISSLTFSAGSRRARILVAVGLVLGAMAPFAWGQFDDSSARLRTTVSPYLNVARDGGIAGTAGHHLPIRRLLASHTGRREADRFIAGPQDKPGALASFFLPIQIPGLYSFTANAQTSGQHTAIITSQRLLAARQPWSQRRRTVIDVDDAGKWTYTFYNHRRQLANLFLMFGGQGHLDMGRIAHDLVPQPLSIRRTPIQTVSAEQPPHALRVELVPGRYTMRAELSGTAWSTLFEHHPEPVKLAVAVSNGDSLRRQHLLPWFSSNRSMRSLSLRADDVPLQREALVAPWWSVVPIAGAQEFELSFVVGRPGPVWLLYDYEGDAELRLDQIVLDRLSLDEAAH